MMRVFATTRHEVVSDEQCGDDSKWIEFFVRVVGRTFFPPKSRCATFVGLLHRVPPPEPAVGPARRSNQASTASSTERGPVEFTNLPTRRRSAAWKRTK